MNFAEARDTVLALLRQSGKAKNSEMLALIGGDKALLEQVREDLLFDELAEDVRGAGLRYGAKAASGESPGKEASSRTVKVFLSYGRRDAHELAERLKRDLTARGYEVWCDTSEIKSGTDWQTEIIDGLRSAQIVIALMTPHSTRTTRDVSSRDEADSVCLGELAYALFNPPPQPVVPVMAQTCEPPLAIFHLDYVDMRRWEEGEEQYRAGLERLLDGLAAAQHGEKRYRSWHHLLNPFDFAAFLHAKREGFTGRRWLFDAIDVWRQSSPHDRALLIKGDPGAGKSSVVAELVHRNPGGQVLAYHCCQWDTAQTLEPWRFVQSIAAMIAGKLEDYAARLADPNIRDILGEAACREDPGSAFELGVLTPLQHLHAPEGGARYLLVDALDEALLVPPGKPDLVSVLASRLDRLPPWLRLVATTRKEPAVLERLAGLRATEIEAQSADNLSDLRAYIHGRLETAALVEQVREAKQSAEVVTSRLVEKSEGNFLYARQALDGVVAGLHSLTALGTLPPGLRGLYADRFARLFPDEASFAPARSLLAVVCAAREPLGRELLALASGLDLETALPRVLTRLAAYLPRQTVADSHIAYAVFHKSLADWLANPERAGQIHYVSLREGHERLAETCWQSYQSGVEALPSYVLSHLVTHLLAAKRWENVEEAFLDLPYLETRVRAGQAFQLVEGFAAATSSLPADRAELPRLGLLEEALRRDVHFIARHARDYPQALFQCLWNSAWWYDSPEAEAHYAAPDGSWKQPPPWRNPLTTSKLCTLLERWRAERTQTQTGFRWVRSLRPPYLALGSGQLAVMRGHEQYIRSVTFSPDGHRVASGSADRTVRLWDAENGRQLLILKGHEDDVTSVAFSPDGRRVASASHDKTVRLWDAQTGQELTVLRGHKNFVLSVAFSPDGRRVASGGRGDPVIRLWDAETGRQVAMLQVDGWSVDNLAFSPDGRRLASVSGSEVRLWEAQTGRELAVLSHKWGVSGVAFSPDGHRVASCSSDVRIWNTENGQELVVLPGHGEIVTSVAFSPDGRRVASASYDKTVRLWDSQTGRELAVLRGHEGAVNSLAFSPDGYRVASGAWDKTVRLWNTQTSREWAAPRDHEMRINSVAFSPNGLYVASGSSDKTIRLWGAQDGRELSVLRGQKDAIHSVAFSPHGRHLISGSLDETTLLWDVKTEAKLATLRSNTFNLHNVAFSPDGRRLAGGEWDGTVRFWNIETGLEVAALRGHKDIVYGVAFSPDGRRLATGSSDGTVRFWDAETGQQLTVLRGHEDTILTVAFSPDGHRVVSGSEDGTVRVWDATTGKELTVLRGHSSHVTFVALSPDGRWVASVAGDPPMPTVRLGDAETRREVAMIRRYGHDTWNVAFRADGRCLVSRSDDEMVLWDVHTGQCREVFKGGGDVKAIAAGGAKFPWRAMTRDDEIAVESNADGAPVAWFSESLTRITTHPDGRTWAGSAGSNHLVLFRLEDERE